MEITRRNLIRATAALGGVAAVGGRGLAAEAVAGVRVLTTLERTLVRGDANAAGWRKIVSRPGAAHRVRDPLTPAKSGRRNRRTPMLTFVQFSDVHIVDAQSPMRFESQDKKPDGSGVSASAYRPQEVLSGHTAEAMVRQINAITTAPVLEQPLAFAIQTGDNSDNGQYNEIRWNIDILDGGKEVRVDSGDLTKYEGVMDQDPAFYDPMFYHPDGHPAGAARDVYQTKRGFPKIPGLLDRARQPFTATGLSMPWYVALGNHDELVQGNFPHGAVFNNIAVGSTKQTTKGPRTVTADADRRLLSRAETVAEHFTTVGAPVGHGFTSQNQTDGTAYYAFDAPGGLVRVLVMDSIKATGTDRGEIDATQLAWLQSELDATTDQLVIAASHHPSWTFFDPANGKAVVDLFASHPNFVAWVNGHTHKNNVRLHRAAGGGGFWEVNTCAHIDWPIQSRIIEIADNHDGTVSIFTTLVDHSAPLNPGRYDSTMKLAGLARAMAANDIDPEVSDRRGKRKDRNVELVLPAPAFLQPA
jgi:metallophosphoesterase (TIGR03767 family)